MSRNGSGTYSLPVGNPVVTGTTISSTTHNSTLSDIASEITNSVAADGQTTPTANLPMGTYKHTNVGDASARTDYGKVSQIQDGGYVTLSSVAGTNTITATCSPAITAYANGQWFQFVSAGANTGAATLNINALGAKAITKEGTTALAAGDIASGAVIQVSYDGTQFQLVAGRSVQPLDAELSALAGLTSAANKVPMFAGVGAATMLDFKDEDNMASDSATALPSQQSVKAYVDTQVATSVADSEFTGANQSLLAEGYQKLPGGLIMQWGQQTVAAATTGTYSFPLAFPTACLQFIAGTDIDGPAANQRNDSTGGKSISVSQYQLRQGSSSGALTIHWFAVGH